MGTATAIGGNILVERIKNNKSSFNGTLNLENAYAANAPRNTDANVEPKPIIIEFEYLPKNFEGPVITISLLLTSSSYQFSGGGNESRYSGDCLDLLVNKLTYPSKDGSNNTSGGYEIALSTFLKLVITIQDIGIKVITV